MILASESAASRLSSTTRIRSDMAPLWSGQNARYRTSQAAAKAPRKDESITGKIGAAIDMPWGMDGSSRAGNRRDKRRGDVGPARAQPYALMAFSNGLNRRELPGWQTGAGAPQHVPHVGAGKLRNALATM